MKGSEASEQKGAGLPSVELELFGSESFGAKPQPKRRARPPCAWSMQITLPQVREERTDPNGAAVKVRTPEAIAAQCADMATAAQEMFCVFDLNAKNNVIDRRLVTLGILDASLVHPREVFRGALLNNAAAVVVTHKHPSGDPTPSAEDIRITRQLVEAGKILGIAVLDHVVIGRATPDHPAFQSLREAGLISFA